MTKKQELKRKPVDVCNPRYEGAMPAMVGRALLRRESKDKGGEDEPSPTVADPSVQSSI